MKSTSGNYFQSLDHVRALAAFLVFVWHFNHFRGGELMPPLGFGLSVLTEGHTGVSIFMVLSGYLFTRLIGERDVNYLNFLWSRFVCLAPLLLLIMTIVGIETVLNGQSLLHYIKHLVLGTVFPRWPNGGWSLAVEMHFYVLLPLLLAAARYRPLLLIPSLLAVAIALRFVVWAWQGTVEDAAYFTLIGRIDQFLLGILAARLRDQWPIPGIVAAAVLAAFLAFWHWFDVQGGFYSFGAYPSASAIWVVIPTIEAVTFATLIAWYDRVHVTSDHWISRFVAKIGTWSYSIYLLHYFVVFSIPVWFDSHVLRLQNRWVVLAFACAAFLAMLVPAWMSYRFIETPFLRFRIPYLRQRVDPTA